MLWAFYTGTEAYLETQTTDKELLYFLVCMEPHASTVTMSVVWPLDPEPSPLWIGPFCKMSFVSLVL